MMMPARNLSRHVLSYAGATVVQGVLSIALLPLATTVLGPADYGVYAYAMAVLAMAVVLSDPGGGILLSRYKGALVDTDFRRLVATSLFVISGLGCGLAVIIALIWPWLAAIAGMENALSRTGLTLMCVSVPLRAMIGIGTMVFILEARSAHLGAVVCIQSLLTFAFSLYGLFMLEMGVDALFLGNAAGAIAATTCLAVMLRDRLGLPERKWATSLAKEAPSVISAAIMDGIRPVVESAALARGAGLAGLGIFSHSKMYYSYLMQATNAFAYALWPRALAAARVEGDSFTVVRRAWKIAYFGLTAVGLAFASFGSELVGLLTNGKFVDAAPWATAWVSYLLIQNSGKPATAIMFAAGEGAKVSRIRALTVFVSICLLAVLTPGLDWVMAIALGEIIAFRGLVGLASRKIKAVDNGDVWPFGGALLIGVLAMIMHGQSMEFGYRFAVFLVAMTGLAIAGRSVIADGARQLAMMRRRDSRRSP